jgi:hypothetical protein
MAGDGSPAGTDWRAEWTALPRSTRPHGPVAPGAIQRLLAAGAQVDALGAHWQSTPLLWALAGSSERRAANPHPDWPETVRILLDAGADTSQIDLDPADLHYPSPEVVEFLRTRGITPRVEL